MEVNQHYLNIEKLNIIILMVVFHMKNLIMEMLYQEEADQDKEIKVHYQDI
jgi:hypothetical protein